jgi:hypothetical protein
VISLEQDGSLTDNGQTAAKEATFAKAQAQLLQDEMTLDLIDHIERLKSKEPTFWSATAVSKYGRRFDTHMANGDLLKFGEPKACFRNAARTALLRDGLFYAEGYAIEPDLQLPMEHAWLVDRSGRVVDPTWRDSHHHTYFGIAFKPDFVQSMLEMLGGEPGVLVNMHEICRHLGAPLEIERAISDGLMNFK